MVVGRKVVAVVAVVEVAIVEAIPVVVVVVGTPFHRPFFISHFSSAIFRQQLFATDGNYWKGR